MVGALHNADVLVADGYCLPFRSQCADGVLSIAVLHHIPTWDGRVAMVREIVRCLKPGTRRGYHQEGISLPLVFVCAFFAHVMLFAKNQVMQVR